MAERSFRSGDLPLADLPLFGRLVDDLSCGRQVRDLGRINDLSSGAKGVLFWAMAHYGWVDAGQAPTLLTESGRLLGMRPVIARDLDRIAQHLEETRAIAVS